MARGSIPVTATEAATAEAPKPGARVWMLRDGRFGRVVATAQGGLVCRVRPEGGGPVVECAGGELFHLDATPPG